jgi:ubiquinone/menaquinone biosynthesis C-methylase UbiE
MNMVQQRDYISFQDEESLTSFSEPNNWNKLFKDFLTTVDVRIAHFLNPNDTDTMLNLMTGTVESRITIASTLNGQKTVSGDLAKEMLETPRQNAHQNKINHHAVDPSIARLPFADNTVDVVNSRFGCMFFPDLFLAADEISRIMRPGARMATTIWSIPENSFWVITIQGIIRRNMKMTTHRSIPKETFQCAEDGLVSSVFLQAGIKNVSIQRVTGTLHCTASDFQEALITEIAVPFLKTNVVDFTTKEKIKREVNKAIEEKYPTGNIEMSCSALIIYGLK